MRFCQPLCMFHFVLLAAVAATASAQTGELLQYQQEIGAGVGMMSYIGDASGGFMKNPSLMGTLLWRRNINQRMVVKTNLGLGHVHGTTKGTFIPADATSGTPEGGTATQPIHFGRNVLDAGVQFALNFLGYGLGEAYKGLKRWTPYLLAGAGLTVAMGGGGKAAAGFNIPLGVGFRYKVAPRVNLGLEWTIRFTTTDGLDDNGQKPKLEDPYGIESGMFKNKDCYTMTYVFITYDISPKYRKCNN